MKRLHYRVSLFIGLLSFYTLSSCVNTRESLGATTGTVNTLWRDLNRSCYRNPIKTTCKVVGLICAILLPTITTTWGLSHYFGNQFDISNNNGTDLTAIPPTSWNTTNRLGVRATNATIDIEQTEQFVKEGIRKNQAAYDNNTRNTTETSLNSNATQIYFLKAVREGNLTEIKKILSTIDGSKESKELFLNSVSNEKTAIGTAIEQGSESVVALLMQQPQININKTGRGIPSLLLALKCQKPNIANILLTQSGNKTLNVRDSLPGSNINPLRLAIIHHYKDIVKTLLDPKYKIDVNEKDKNGNTFLHSAANFKDANIVKLLLEAPDIQVNTQNNNGDTPLHEAARYKGSVDTIKALLEAKNINVNAKNKNGGTALHITAYKDYIDGMQALLRDKNINVNAKNKNGNTALHLATSLGHVDSIKVLLKATNINVNTKNKDGNTALHLAANDGDVYATKALLRATNIDVNAKNKNGDTALHLAVKNSDINLLKALLKAKSIDINVLNNNGITPLDLAQNINHPEVIRLLQEAQTQH